MPKDRSKTSSQSAATVSGDTYEPARVTMSLRRRSVQAAQPPDREQDPPSPDRMAYNFVFALLNLDKGYGEYQSPEILEGIVRYLAR